MKFAAIIDIAAFIWDEQQFNIDQTQFYPMVESIPNILNMLVEEKIPVVFREELLNEVKLHFPYSLIPKQFRDFKNVTIRQLTKLNMIDYGNPINAWIKCNPSLIRGHFARSTQQELKHLLGYLYQDNERIQRLLTFSVLWEKHANMILRNGIRKIISTEICDSENRHRDIVNGLKKIFEHNPKHRVVVRFFRGRKISPFRFYNPRRKKETIQQAQLLLDKSVNVEGCYYSKHVGTGIYVRFLKTEKNLFHGFEVIPDDKLKEKIENAFKDD